MPGQTSLIIMERNKRLMVWIAAVEGLNREEKQRFYAEMQSACKMLSDVELARYVFEELAPKGLLPQGIEGAKQLVERFSEEAKGWFRDLTSS